MAAPRRAAEERSGTGRAVGRLGPLRWLVAAAVLVAVVAFVAGPARVSSDSMAPTLRAGDRVLVQELGQGGRVPARRAVIVFHQPDGSGLAVKRVVGLPGDEVALEDGVLVVDGEPVDEPGVDVAGADAIYFGPVTVPPGTVFVLGDARGDSIDSRHYGPVPVADVVGRVLVRLWPPWR